MREQVTDLPESCLERSRPSERLPDPMRRNPLVLLLAVLLLAGCATTSKRFDKAGELEAQGRFVEAAEAYIGVLERDRSYDGAADRLADVGARAVTQLFDEARTLDQSGDPASGVDRLDRLRRLVDAAGAVGVALTLPTGFDRMRSRLVDRAVEALRDRARAAEARRDWDKAVEAYDEALERYAVTGAVRRDVVAERARALLEWARAEMASARFRSAYDKAGDAVASLDSTNGALEQEARGVWASALAQGVRTLAVLPFWQTESFRRAAPPRLRDDMNQSLADDRRETPSPFIVLLDPAESRRFVRVERIDDRIIDRNRMADAGRQLDVDFVATGEGVEFVRTERVRREESVRARFRGRGGADTTYTRRDLEVRFFARVEYRVVDVRTGRVRAERAVEADVTDRFTRAVFGRNPADLDLSDRERRQFDPAEWARQDDEHGLQLADRLSSQLAERMYRDVLDLID